MSKIILRRSGLGFVPDQEEDERRLRHVKIGEFIAGDYRKERNIQFHRKFFALINLTMNNQERFKNQTDLLLFLKIKTGHYDHRIMQKGQVIWIPRSINFASMDDVEFSEFYQKALDVIIYEVMIGTTVEELERRVEDIIVGFG